MKIANFRDDVLNALAFVAGLDPITDTSDTLTDQVLAWISFVNRFLERTYDREDYPEWTPTEERTPDATHYIDFDQANQTPIGKPLKLYLRDPAANPGPLAVPIRLGAQGIHCGFNHGATVWLKFMKRAPKFTGTPYDGGATYAKGATIYDPTTGQCYASKQAANMGHAVTETAWWDLLIFPGILAGAVVRGAYADHLRDDGQTDKAAAEEQTALTETSERAGAFLTRPYDALTDQKRPNSRYRERNTTPATAPTP